MMKKVLSLFIVIVLLFNLVSVRSFADAVDNTGDGSYTILDFWNDLNARLKRNGNGSYSPESNVFNPNVSADDWWTGLMESSFGDDGVLSQMPEELVNGIGGSAKDLAEWIGDVFTPWWIKNKGTGVVDMPDMPYLVDHQYYLTFHGGIYENGVLVPDGDIRYTYYFNAPANNDQDLGEYILIRGCSNVVLETMNVRNGGVMYSERSDTAVSFNKNLLIATNYPFGSSSDIPATPPSSTPQLDITTMTPGEYEDMLEELDEQAQIYINIEFPDLTSIKGLLDNIRALLAEANNKMITADDLQSLAASMGCKCPTEEQLNAAIMTLIGKDKKNFTDVVNVLLDIKKGEKGLNDIYDQLKLLNAETNIDNFAMAIDPADTEFAAKFPGIVDSIFNLISQLRGVDEFVVVSTLIGSFQNILLYSNYQPMDITFDLSFLGVDSEVVILRAADFTEGGRLYQGLQTAKQLVSILIVMGWLMLMRKRYLLMFEIASNS